MQHHNTRESWLGHAVQELTSTVFAPLGYDMPDNWAVSTGFARGGRDVIGQCWSPAASENGEVTHMFICPTQGDAMKVLGILAHEMIHAMVGNQEGHRGNFKKLAKEIGLAGKMTATYVPEESDLHRQMRNVLSSLGDYPHVAIRSTAGGRRPADPSTGKPKDPGGEEGPKKNRYQRLVSPENEEYKALVSPRLIELYGLPKDPWGNEMVVDGNKIEWGGSR